LRREKGRKRRRGIEPPGGWDGTELRDREKFWGGARYT